jgi:hypothetical protein
MLDQSVTNSYEISLETGVVETYTSGKAHDLQGCVEACASQKCRSCKC